MYGNHKSGEVNTSLLLVKHIGAKLQKSLLPLSYCSCSSSHVCINGKAAAFLPLLLVLQWDFCLQWTTENAAKKSDLLLQVLWLLSFPSNALKCKYLTVVAYFVTVMSSIYFNLYCYYIKRQNQPECRGLCEELGAFVLQAFTAICVAAYCSRSNPVLRSMGPGLGNSNLSDVQGRFYTRGNRALKSESVYRIYEHHHINTWYQHQQAQFTNLITLKSP